MVVFGVVQYQYQTFAAGTMLEQSPQKALEGFGVELRLELRYQFAGAYADRPEAGHRLARRRMQYYWVFVFWRHPHSTARTMLLEMAFVGAPQVNLWIDRQTAQFF